MDDLDPDGLLAQLGVVIEAKGKVRKAPEAAPRHTEWREGTTFVFEGYVAIVAETTCEGCGGSASVLEGVFTRERNPRTGATRMQALGRGQQWPVGGGHKMEVRHRFTPVCPACLEGMGFVKVEGE